MNYGFAEVPNKYISKVGESKYSKIGDRARILLIGLIDFSKKYGYCNYDNKKLEELIGLKEVSRLIKKLEKYKCIKVSESEEENIRSIIPDFFYDIDFSDREHLNTSFDEEYKKKLHEGFTPIPKVILFNQNISCRGRLIYSYFLKLVNNKQQTRNYCYPTYPTINGMLGLGEKTKTIQKTIEELEDLKINDNKILIKEEKGTNRGYMYYPLCKVKKINKKHKVVFLNEKEFLIKEIEPTREDLLEEIDILKKALLEEGIRIVKNNEDGNRYKFILNELPPEHQQELLEKKGFETFSDERLIEGYKKFIGDIEKYLI